jgi:MFS transporter, PPP family, 3-phenylpropionic acid transporter
VSASRPLAIRLSLLFAGLFTGLGLYLPFFPIFLSDRGLAPDDIALILFVPIVVRAAAAPFVASLADRLIDPALFLGLSNIGVALLFALSAFASDVSAFLVLSAFIALLQSASIPLSDALTIKAAQTHPDLNYGRVRLWGSVAFFIANVGGGFLLALLGAVSIPLAIALCTASVLPIIWPLRGQGREVHPSDQPPIALGQFLLVIIAASALIQASHAYLYSFGSLLWSAQGYSSEMIGAIWALNIISEVMLFWFFGSAVGPRFPAFSFLLLGGSAAALRWVVMAFEPSGFVLALCQLTHGLSFGATHLGAIALLARFVPSRARGRAQGLLSAMTGGLTALITLGSGWLYTEFGAAGFWLMVPLAVLGALLTGGAYARQPQSRAMGG